MLKSSLIILGLAACLMAEVRRMRIDHSMGRVMLQPPMRGPSDTTFELKTCANCKMVLLCALEDPNCNRVSIKIWDGKNTWNGCEPIRQVAMNTSIRGDMSVQIRTSGSSLPAVCMVTATKPYIGLPEERIDSSEHGLETSKASCRCGWTNKRGQRIVGGKETKVNEYPFPVLILLKARMFPFCGGSIITPYHALTAAHCTQPMAGQRLAILAGEHDFQSTYDTSATQLIDVAASIDHPGYDTRNNLHDISILYLRSPIKFNDLVGPVCMPERMTNLLNQPIKVMGWGHTSTGGRASSKLLKVNLKVIDPDVCGVIYSTGGNTQICTFANGKDSCQGDSGGPLVVLNPRNMYTQYGVVSYGRECASTDPGVNTNVAAYMDWIRQTIARTNPQRMCH